MKVRVTGPLLLVAGREKSLTCGSEKETLGGKPVDLFQGLTEEESEAGSELGRNEGKKKSRLGSRALLKRRREGGKAQLSPVGGSRGSPNRGKSTGERTDGKAGEEGMKGGRESKNN